MKPRILCAACAGIMIVTNGTAVQAAPVSGQGTREITLQGRDLDGNLSTIEAYYDTALNITWLADANYARTTGYSGVTSLGTMTWSVANNWAADLDPYGSGISGWRLPTTLDVGNDGPTFTNYYQGVDAGYNITAQSEMSHMFYVTLDNTAFSSILGIYPQPGYGLSNTGPFNDPQGASTLQLGQYWSATSSSVNANNAWYFNFRTGEQRSDGLRQTSYFNAWAVHDGDVGVAVMSTVPVPAASWLFGAGLLGLMGMVQKRR